MDVLSILQRIHPDHLLMQYKPVLAIIVLIIFAIALVSAIGLFLYQMGLFN